MSEVIKWEQSFAAFKQGLDKLIIAAEILKDVAVEEEEGEDAEAQAAVDEILKDGLIHRFEYTCRLAWGVMKDFALQDDTTTMAGPADAIREAFKLRLISDVNEWMDILESCKLTAQATETAAADLLYKKIATAYTTSLTEFEEKMEALLEQDN